MVIKYENWKKPLTLLDGNQERTKITNNMKKRNKRVGKRQQT